MNSGHFLVQDDDCHWYIIPFEKTEEWYKFLESDDAELGVEPEWAKRVDGPHRILIYEYAEV